MKHASYAFPNFRSRAGGVSGWAAVAMAFGLCAVASPVLAQSKTDVLVRFAGSQVIGGRPLQALATAWARQLKMPGVHIEAGMDPDEYDVVGEVAEASGHMTVQSRAHGTASGLEPLLRGQADFWMASRAVREADLDAMRKRNVPNVPSLDQFQQPGVENVVGLTALAVVVHPRNPVPNLNFQQLRDIYSGKVTSWAQVGGPSNLPIGVYSLDVNDSDTDTFCGTILGNPDTQKCVDSFPRLAAPRAGMEGGDLADAVAGNPAGIGFVAYSDRRSARALPLGTPCGTGVAPSLFKVKAEEYPMVQRLYLYAAPGRPLSEAAKSFLQFALGPIGQAAVGAAGLADQAPGISDPDYADSRIDTAANAMDGGRTRVRAPDVRAFEAATGGADRLSITFRFQAGTNALDSRAEADMGRLIDLLHKPNYARSTVTLIGFSSAAGDYGGNRQLARDRAEAIRGRLTAAGLQNVNAVGIGPGAAVACNLDPATTMLNQRVEVWLRKAG
jgi:phosphate transport system substrate-binding protein